jgi:hypothetical protein
MRPENTQYSFAAVKLYALSEHYLTYQTRVTGFQDTGWTI